MLNSKHNIRNLRTGSKVELKSVYRTYLNESNDNFGVGYVGQKQAGSTKSFKASSRLNQRALDQFS